jgi:fructokinase
MKQEQLFPLIRKEVVHLLNGYIQAREILEEIDSYIVPPGLGDNAGLAGALALAQNCMVERVYGEALVVS